MTEKEYLLSLAMNDLEIDHKHKIQQSAQKPLNENLIDLEGYEDIGSDPSPLKDERIKDNSIFG